MTKYLASVSAREPYLGVVVWLAAFSSLGPEICASSPEHYFIPKALFPLLSPEQLAQREQTISADRRTAIMSLTIAEVFDQALENVGPAEFEHPTPPASETAQGYPR